MQIVIKIPEDEYNIAKYGQYGNINVDTVRKAIANGTPLPKGHGRLIDADRLYDDFEYADYDFEEALEYAPTVIEADKEKER